MINFDEIYVDQSPYKSQYGNRSISSVFTQYGIQCIDSEYGYRIKNLNRKVELKYRDRVSMKYLDYKTVLVDQNRGFGYHLKYDTTEDDISKEFFYTEPPILNAEGKEDPEILRKQILENIHLHDLIISNLISNLDASLKNY